jgi:hypothetical protein
MAIARGPGTRAGEPRVRITKSRRGSYFPSFLHPRLRSEQLVSVVQEAYAAARSRVATPTSGWTPTGTSQRRRPCPAQVPDARLRSARVRLPRGDRARRRRGGDGRLLAQLPRGLVERGLTGVHLVVSDATPGSRRRLPRSSAVPGSAAARTSCARRSAMPGASSSRCRRRLLRPLVKPPRRQRPDRAERRMARRSALSQRPLARGDFRLCRCCRRVTSRPLT